MAHQNVMVEGDFKYIACYSNRVSIQPDEKSYREVSRREQQDQECSDKACNLLLT